MTAGDVYDYVRARLGDKTESECLSQKVFYKLRRALIANYRIDRNLISPDTNLNDLLTYKEIEEGWPFLQMFIDLETPDFIGAQRGWIGFKPAQVLTIREIVGRLIGLNATKLAIEVNSDENIWQRVVDVTVRQLNVNREDVQKHTSFARDLGMD
ncbi:MAG: hypothetical protein IAF58_00425 [Leptolyngbya sp.]|nr:hypothetical protein [Candidatus Melainabacteria bacterium]